MPDVRKSHVHDGLEDRAPSNLFLDEISGLIDCICKGLKIHIAETLGEITRFWKRIAYPCRVSSRYLVDQGWDQSFAIGYGPRRHHRRPKSHNECLETKKGRKEKRENREVVERQDVKEGYKTTMPSSQLPYQLPSFLQDMPVEFRTHQRRSVRGLKEMGE